MTEGGPIELNQFPEVAEENGRKSELYDYCKEANDQGYTECIWVCFRRSHRWLARDLRLNASLDSIHLDELRKIFGWWKRHSFYSTVGVKEVMVRQLRLIYLFQSNKR
jgi:hypothetical protein